MENSNVLVMDSNITLTVLSFFSEKPCVFLATFRHETCKPQVFFTAFAALFAKIAFRDEPFRFMDVKKAKLHNGASLADLVMYKPETHSLPLHRNASVFGSNRQLANGYGLQLSRFLYAPGAFYPADVNSAAVAYRKELFPNRISLKANTFGGAKTRWLLMSGITALAVFHRLESNHHLRAWHGLFLTLLRNTLRSRLIRLFATIRWRPFRFSMASLHSLSQDGSIRIVSESRYIRSLAADKGMPVTLDKSLRFHLPSDPRSVYLGITSDIQTISRGRCDLASQRMPELFKIYMTTYSTIPSRLLPEFQEPRRRVYFVSKRRLRKQYFPRKFCPNPPKSKALRLDQIFVVFVGFSIAIAGLILVFILEISVFILSLAADK